MKLITLILHERLKQSAADLFHSLEDLKGFTFSQVEGHGPLSSADVFLSDQDKVVGYTPHVRADLLLEDQAVEGVLTAISQSDLTFNKHTLYWVTAVERVGRL